MNTRLDIPSGYAQTRLEKPPTTVLRPYECPECSWSGHAEYRWDGSQFSHVPTCPNHAGTPLDEWA